MTATTALALLVPEHGDSSVLAVTEREVADPGPGEVRVRVAATGVNFIEVYQRQGVYPIPTPFVLGAEGAGTVESVGEGVELAVGDRIAWAAAPGSAADLALVPAAKSVPVPDGLGLDVAAAAMLQGMTAHYLITDCHRVSEGETVVVHAAAGGVGQLLVQLVRQAGARVIATASTADKLAKAEALGADHLINYAETDDLAAAIRALTDDQGVDVVYDGVGRATFDASLAALRRRGTLVLFGGASGQVPPFDLQRLNAGGSLFVTRPKLDDYTATREELLHRSGEIFARLADGRLRLDIGGRYPLGEAAAAYDALEARRSTGKLLLIP